MNKIIIYVNCISCASIIKLNFYILYETLNHENFEKEIKKKIIKNLQQKFYNTLTNIDIDKINNSIIIGKFNKPIILTLI